MTTDEWVADSSAQGVALAVLRHGPIARAELARILNLSSASLTRLTKPLLASGLLAEGSPELIARTGRPSVPLDVVADSAYFIGCKVVVGQLHVVVTDLRGAVVAAQEVPLPASTAPKIISVIVRTVRALLKRYPAVVAVGVGVAGVVDDDGKVRIGPMLGWQEVDLAKEIASAVGIRCVVANDVNAFTQSEHWFGSGRGTESFAVITVGAGIGCGLVVHDQLLPGYGGTAGAIGHQRLKTFGPPCEQGHLGCARALLTSDGIAAQLTAQLGRATSFSDGLQLAESGDSVATQILSEAAYYLGVLAGDVANVVAPQRMLLSGEGIGYALLAEESVRRGLADTRHWTASEFDVVIEPFEFSEWARGAAAMAIRAHVLRTPTS